MEVKMTMDKPVSVKSSGVTFQVYETDGKLLGTLVLSNTRLSWCKGKWGERKVRKIDWGRVSDLFEGSGSRVIQTVTATPMTEEETE